MWLCVCVCACHKHLPSGKKVTTHWFLLCRLSLPFGWSRSLIFLTDLDVTEHQQFSVSTVFGVETSGLPGIQLCIRKTVCSHILPHRCTVQTIRHTELGKKAIRESYLVTVLIKCLPKSVFEWLSMANSGVLSGTGWSHPKTLIDICFLCATVMGGAEGNSLGFICKYEGKICKNLIFYP